MCGRTAQSIRAVETAARLFRTGGGHLHQTRLCQSNDSNSRDSNSNSNNNNNNNNGGGGGGGGVGRPSGQSGSTSNHTLPSPATATSPPTTTTTTTTTSGFTDGDGGADVETQIQISKAAHALPNANQEFVSVHADMNNNLNLQNMSPGYEMFVLVGDVGDNDNNGNGQGGQGSAVNVSAGAGAGRLRGRGRVRVERKVWGLLTRPGSAINPLPKGPSKHFAALMFNARSEDAAPTFGRLIRSAKSCIVPLDGFYEWKASAKNVVGTAAALQKKQPYFVHHRHIETTNTDTGTTTTKVRDEQTNIDHSSDTATSQQTPPSPAPPSPSSLPLYVAGLYNSVPTGRLIMEEDEASGESSRRHEEMLDTFTMFTTAASPPLKWLHTRMPLVLSDPHDIDAWLHQPSARLLQDLSRKVSSQGGDTRKATSTTSHSHSTSTSNTTTPTPTTVNDDHYQCECQCDSDPDPYDNHLAWHPVTKQMNSAQYHGEDCMTPVTIETLPSVTSFFGKMADTAAEQKQQQQVKVNLKQKHTGYTNKPSSLSAFTSTSTSTPIMKSHALPVRRLTKNSVNHDKNQPQQILRSSSAAVLLKRRSNPNHPPVGGNSNKHKHSKLSKSTSPSPSTKKAKMSTAAATKGTPSITCFFTPKKANAK
jgi:putative SOS response-associated peptidase YedK